jgi:hypothetical protein
MGRMSGIPAEASGIDFKPMTRRSWPLARRIGWALVTATSMLVGAYAVFIVATGFALVPQEVAANRFPSVLGLRTHIVASGIALLTGPFQFLRSLRRRFPVVHRMLGRTYVVACIIAVLRVARSPCSHPAAWWQDSDSSA